MCPTPEINFSVDRLGDWREKYQIFKDVPADLFIFTASGKYNKAKPILSKYSALALSPDEIKIALLELKGILPLNLTPADVQELNTAEVKLAERRPVSPEELQKSALIPKVTFSPANPPSAD